MAGVYSVTQITAYIKHILEQDFVLNRVCVKGEVSNCKYHTSGHLYFTLKDKTAAISCIMFAGSRTGREPRIYDGLQLQVKGRISFYDRDSKCQLVVSEMEVEGKGELYQIFEERKRFLEELGLFAAEYKKPIPRFAQTVGIVTAQTGAAIRDIINVASRRNPYVQLILCPCQVQGEGAAASIVRAIETLDAIHPDCMIVGRGGGPIEDLWAFNEECVARAIFDCDTPVISAVGHEIDFTISDFAADLRAPTPSAAAELAVFDYAQFANSLNTALQRLVQAQKALLERKSMRVEQDFLKLKLLHPGAELSKKREQLSAMQAALNLIINQKIQQKRHSLELFSGRLEAASPLRRLSGGYALITDEKQQAIESAAQIETGEVLQIHMKDALISARVEKVADRSMPAVKGMVDNDNR